MRARLVLATAGLALVAGCGAGPARPVDPAVVALTDPGASNSAAPSVPHPTAPGTTGATAPIAAPEPRISRPGERLVVASRRIDATLRPVRFHGAELGIPAAISEVGLWADGAGLDDAIGTTVLVGHVSDDHDRPGMMARLGGVRVGAIVSITPRRGAPRRFRVVQRHMYAKSALPRGVFTQTGPHRLVLITCSHRITLPGGGFHYAQNLVVVAVPVR